MIKKTKTKLSLLCLTLVSSPLALLSVVSCSNNSESSNNNAGSDNNAGSNNNTEVNDLQKLINEGKISIDPKINFPKEIFDQYKSDYNELKKIFKIVNNSENKSLNLSFSISSASLNSDQKSVNYIFKIKDDYSNQEATLNKSINLGLNLATYYDSVYNFLQGNIELKQEYANERIIDLFYQSQEITNEEFINKYINLSQLNQDILGVSFELEIPSQVLNMDENDNTDSHYFRLKLTMRDNKGNDITPSTTSKAPYLKVKQEQKDTFTIINDIDLLNSSIESLGSNSYFGTTFIRRKSKNSFNKLTIKTNLSNKNIVGILDLSQYDEIIFEKSASFSNNLIENVNFKSSAKVNGLNGSKFRTNQIKSIILPATIIDFSLSCFDTTVKIKGLENIQNIDWVINNDSNDLDLSKLSYQQIDDYFSILARWSSSQKLSTSFKNVILPSEYLKLSRKPSVNLTCEKLQIDNLDNSIINEWFADFSSWNIKEINIPSYIIKIDKSKLPSNANVTRELNEEIKSLVKSTASFPSKHLEINSDNKFPLTNETIKNAFSNFDKYFYTFNSPNPLNIEAIVFNSNDYPSSYYLKNYWTFLNQLAGPIKLIINQDKINFNSYTSLKDFVNEDNKKYLLIRNSTKKSLIINNKVLLLNKLNEINDNDLSQYLVGLENDFDSIDTTNISEIKQNSFAYLSGKEWENKTINLTSNIEKISEGAFNSSSIKITFDNNFNPNEVGASAFYSSTLSGQLNWNNLKTVGVSAFRNTKITSITFSDQITNLPANIFNGCSSLTDVNLPNIILVGTYAFQNCYSLVSLNFPKLNEINDSAFYNCSKLTGFNNLSLVTKLGSNAFYSCRSLKGQIILNENVQLGNDVFRNCSDQISFKNFNVHRDSVISLLGNNSLNYNSIDLNITDQDLFKKINYNNGILDLSDFDSNSVENMNYLYYFKSLKLPIEKLVMPQLPDIDEKISNCFKDVSIQKLEWNSNSKNLTKTIVSLFGKNIQSLDENFFENISTIPANVMTQLNIANATFNLNGVKEVKDNAFNNLSNAIFKNTQEIKIIGSKSFKSDANFEIGYNVQLKEDSFTLSISDCPDVTRKDIFYNNDKKIAAYMKIYNPQTKVLDFTKMAKSDNISLYTNIGNYLVSGDVEKLILPTEYKLTADLLNNLGTINEIVFNNKNQIIESNAFLGTTILNKPSKNQTRIILDLDNFFTS